MKWSWSWNRSWSCRAPELQLRLENSEADESATSDAAWYHHEPGTDWPESETKPIDPLAKLRSTEWNGMEKKGKS